MRTKRPDRPPLELDDYSGEFQPDLRNMTPLACGSLRAGRTEPAR
jgi:hypothetical protein